ncbi:hypothetical protein O6H91_08G032000 [Diphasiastrum complanatum]|uniref:Uncharacterized protein n=1 Tax=Diphasiastrum complanatum TaxID=34168 RepID=A0ACC2CWI0_DIPCM|nr:hypothetical protein O6H91_08G032000 [Diphasiastrum complanatum]
MGIFWASFWIGLILALASASGCLSKQRSSEYLLPKPEIKLEQKGGKVLAWPSHSAGLKETNNIGASLLELHSHGLLLPAYSDSAQICYVIQGRATSGLIDPNGKPTNVRYVRAGDVVLVLPGWPFWLWNTANFQTKALCVLDTATGVNPGSYKPFFLAGSKGNDTGGILHGFSRDILAHAWDVDEDHVERVLAAKEMDFIIKVKPEPRSHFSFDGSADFGEFTFNMQTARADAIERGGWLTFLNENKLPNLHEVDLGASLVKLNPGSLFSPQWLTNADQLVYVLKGRGKVEIARPRGKEAFSEQVEEGDMFVVPKLAPYVIVASDDNPFEWISFYTSSESRSMFLAGSESVFRSIPLDILAASFNVSSEILSKIESQRVNGRYILKFP